MLLSEKEVSGAYMPFFQRNYVLHCPGNLEAVTCSPPVLPWLCRGVEVGFLLKTYSGILINFLPDKKKYIYNLGKRREDDRGDPSDKHVPLYPAAGVDCNARVYFGNWQGDVGCSATWMS